MDAQLGKTKYLAGDKVTIADIACWGWVSAASKSNATIFDKSAKLTRAKEWAGVDVGEFPNLKRWLYELLERPGFEAGRHVPAPHKAFELNDVSEEELEKKAAESRNWVQAGMKADAKK